ncbi:MAG: YadA-like family protein, partial [Acinetobacter sp.]
STNTTDISTLKGGFTLQTNGANAGAIKAGDTVDIGVADLADTNLTATKTGKDIAFALSKDLSLTSVTTGNTVINNAGLTADKVTVGNVVIDKTTNKITGIEAGTSTKDAVNKGQLDALAAQQTATDSAAVKYDNAATKDKVTLGGGAAGTTITNVKDGALNASSTDAVNGRQLYATNQNVAQNTTSINALNTTVNNHGTQISTNTTDISTLKGGFTLQTNGANAGAIKAGDTVDIGVADPVDTNLTATKIGKNIAFALNKDLNLTSVMTGNTVINNAGITADKVSVGNVVIDKSTNKITGIEAGTSTKDAVNKGQLDALAAQQTATDSAAVKYDNAATKDKVTLGGGAAGTTITNVKAGGVNASSSDAINGSQLYAVSNNIKNAIGGSTTINAATGAITTTNIGGTGANTIDDAINSVSNTAKAAKTEVKEGDNVKVTSVVGTDGQSIYTVATAKDVSFDKVTVGGVVLNKANNDITGLSNKNLSAADFATQGRAATEEQLKMISDAQTATDNAAVKYDNALTKDKVTLGGTTTSSTKDAITGKITTTGGTSLSNVASAGDYTNIANASKGVNAGDLNNAVIDAKTAVTNTGIKFGNGTSSNKYKLGDIINVKASTDGSITSTTTADGVQLGLGNTVKVGSGATQITVDGSTGKIGGLSNKTWNAASITSGQAATEDQLKLVSDAQTATDSAAVKYDSAATKDKVTLGGIGGTTLTNVKAGAVNASSSDAINGSQLHAVSDSVKNAIGGSTSINAVTGAITTNNIGGTGANTIDGAINNVSNTAKAAKTEVKEGDNVKVTSVAGTDGQSIYTVATAKDVSFDKVTVGGVVLNKANNDITGLSNKSLSAADFATQGRAATEEQLKTVSDAQSATDASAVKYDNAITKDKVTLGGATGTTISNVKAGALNASSTDAVNGSQLYATNQNVAQNTASISTLNTTVSNQGTQITTNTADISTLKGGFTLQSNGANAGAIKAGNTVDIGVADLTDSNLTATKTGNSIAFALSKDLTLNSVTTNQLAVGTIAIDKATNTITGLSNKDLKAADFATKGRAATEEQLKQVISSNITEVVDASGNKVNIIDQVVNTKLDNTNQDSLFLTYNKQGQETTDRLTIGQTVQKMNTEGTKFFHTNADTSKGDLGTTNDSSASGLNSTAIGVNAIVAAGADSSVALGHNAKVQGAQSIAIGHGAEALGTQSISIGTGNKVKGNHSGAIGDPSIVNGSNSYSVGNNNQVLTDDTFVLGNNVTKTVAGSVVLGTGSAATTGAGVTGYALSTATNVDKTAINKTTSTTGAVAVGDAASGIYRQITGVAAGTQDADAVNVAQLKAVGNQVVTTQNSLVNSLGGNATVNANGTITGPTYNVAKSTQTNVGDALDALDKAIASTAVTSKTTVTKGQNIVVNKSKNADGSDNYEIETAKDLTVDSVKAGNTILNNAGITIGNNTVVLNNTGLIIAGGPSVTTQGINAGNKQITNVAAGTNTTDAVNKGQLDSAINSVASDVTQLSNNAVKYDTASKDKITLGGSNGTTITNLKDGAVVKGSKDAVNGGQLWTVQQQVNQNTNDIQGIQTNISNINNGKSGLVQQQTPNGDITVGKDAGGTKLNVSGTQGERVVTGVKDGAINATSKDAVNGSQLNVTNNKVAEYLGGGAKFDNEKWTAPSYTVGHGSTAQSYADVGGAVDALNKADQALGNRITNLGDRLEQAFTETNQRIDGIEKKANAGIAAAMALEAAPFVAGKYTYAVGAAYHGGENAVGVTLRKTADNGRWSLTGGVAAASQGDPSVRIGISGVID